MPRTLLLQGVFVISHYKSSHLLISKLYFLSLQNTKTDKVTFRKRFVGFGFTIKLNAEVKIKFIERGKFMDSIK